MSRYLNHENLLILTKESAWLLLTGMITFAVLYPVLSKLDYMYTTVNAAFVFVAITYFRWSVTFRSIPFLRPASIRFLIFTGNIILFFYLMQHEQKLLGKLDDFYLEDFGFPKVIIYEDLKQQLFSYLYAEIVLSATSSLLMIIAFQLRLILSYWQYYKHASSRLLED